MTERTDKRGRGRPPTGNAATPSERMKAMRAKALETVRDPDGDLSTVSDTGLLEALRVAYRDRQTETLRRIVDELISRAENPA